MTAEMVRLVTVCDREIMRRLIDKLAPEEAGNIDWTLSGRDLGTVVQSALSGNQSARVRLQNVAGIARHGSVATVPSVLYNLRDLRAEYEELPEGRETASAWLALTNDELFERALSALHVDQGLNKRSWEAYRARITEAAKLTFSEPCLQQFGERVREAIRQCQSFDAPGELQTHHFNRVLFREDSTSHRSLEQVTVFAEARQVTEETFVESRVQTRLRKRVDSISVIFDRSRGELDVVTIGGWQFRKSVATAFFAAFSSEVPPLAKLIRRTINFGPLSCKPELVIADQRHFIEAFVDEIRVKSPGGSLLTFDAKSQRSDRTDVYAVAEQEFGERSPFRCPGWTVMSARLQFVTAPKGAGRSSRFRTVDLKSNGHTNLHEQDEVDRHIADECLTAWGILEPAEDDGDGE